MTLAVIGLGSSLGDRSGSLRLASQLFCAHPEISVVACSRIWQSAPAGGVARGVFHNAALSAETTLPAAALLSWCKAIEARLGRRPAVRWADRVIDVDILMYGSQSVSQPGLQIPHPRLLVRDFALRPAQEVAAGLEVPGLGRSLGEIVGVRGRMRLVGVLSVGALARRRRTHYSEPVLAEPASGA